jgi:hypothetical protein
MADEKRYFFDDPKNVRLVLYALYVCCALLLLVDFFIHRHVIHDWERLIGFYAIYGFVVCTFIVLGAKVLRTVLMRGEDYYKRKERQAQTNEGREPGDA